MTKFNVGDKVAVVSRTSWSGPSIGLTGSVKKIDKRGHISLDGIIGKYRSNGTEVGGSQYDRDRLELITPELLAEAKLARDRRNAGNTCHKVGTALVRLRDDDAIAAAALIPAALFAALGMGKPT